MMEITTHKTCCFFNENPKWAYNQIVESIYIYSVIDKDKKFDKKNKQRIKHNIIKINCRSLKNQKPKMDGNLN